MSKTKKWLIAAAALVVSGALLFVGIMTGLKWDFLKLSTVQYERNSYDIQEEFQSISIIGNTSDITFIATQDEMASVFCYEAANARHSVSVENGTLIIAQADQQNWYNNIGINLHDPDIKVYLPQTQYVSLLISESTGDIEIPADFSFDSMDISLSTGDVKTLASAGQMKIKTTTGSIQIENISTNEASFTASTGKITVRSVACQGDLQMRVSTGDISLTDVVCDQLVSTGNTGDISLKNVHANQQFTIERTTGDVTFENCDAGAITVTTGTGDVTGNLLSEKIFIATTNTGDVDVPQTGSGGICEITTNTGDITITVN